MILKIRCPACKGAKHTMKIGYVKGNCEECKGLGYVDEVISLNQHIPLSSPPTKEIKSDVKKSRTKTPEKE